ncbi:sensor histidine kinase [Dyadobacter luteus]|jgi:two-component system LytT family sensor kinase|nr:histidine kinase [Dyadobacter luteus]
MDKNRSDFLKAYLIKQQTAFQRTKNHILFWIFFVLFHLSYFIGSKDKLTFSPQVVISYALYYLRFIPVYYITALVYSRIKHLFSETWLWVATGVVLTALMHIFNVLVFYAADSLYGLANISTSFQHFGTVYLHPFADDSYTNIWLSISYDIREIELLILPLAIKGIKYTFKQQVAKSELKAEKLSLQLVALRSQVAPHFLINNLMSLKDQLTDVSEKLANYVENLTNVLSFTLYQSQSDFVVFKQEWTALTKLLDLEANRFSQRLKVSLQIESPLPKDSYIPSMILFTLVENALKHGLYLSSEKECYITLKLEVIGQRLRFVCINSIAEPEDEKRFKKNSGLGHRIIRERLELICKNNYSFYHQRTDSTYTVELILPLTDSHPES